jgi:hypothetical protein
MLKKMFVALIVMFGSMGTAQAIPLVYELDQTSTIWLAATGETYSVTGSFTWGEPDIQGDMAVFSALALNFSGGPASIFLNSAPIRTATSVFLNDDPDRCGGLVCDTYFNAPVDMQLFGGELFTELGFSVLGEGTYAGDFVQPTFLSYTDLGLYAETGGAPLARLNLHASLSSVPVPEPGTFALTLVALCIGFGARRRARH